MQYRRTVLSMIAVPLLLAATVVVAPAQTFTTLASFTGPNGKGPRLANLAEGTNGNFYGTTYYGGSHNGNGCVDNCGTVFEITAAGKLTTLYNFCSLTKCADGALPSGGLVQAMNGNFYGTTTIGGTSSDCGVDGCGTVFEITPAGKLTTLHSFSEADGIFPSAAVIQASDGNFYGTTAEGGTSSYGTVFKITASGSLTTLHSFDGRDGGLSNAALIQATNGNFYGTTHSGGANSYGTVFEITPAGQFTLLHSFAETEGAYPYAGLVQASNGNFYGVTYVDGASSDGTVYEITPAGALTVLHSFDHSDGENPEGTLVQATDGNLYGTTSGGGSPHVVGNIFKITTAGAFTNLFNLCPSCGDGEGPRAGLIQGTNGNFYGTTAAGGADDDGTVFSLSVGLKPFVEIASTSGKEGAKVGILGQDFSSSSVVKFGGTKATTIVLTGTTLITATVPSGALTGNVTVTTGTTTLTSAKTFDVLPTITSFSPTSGPVETSVTITGTGLEQTAKVTFDGKSATFTVIKDTEVTAEVPTGAETGKIVVTTKGGSTTSATNFTVN